MQNASITEDGIGSIQLTETKFVLPLKELDVHDAKKEGVMTSVALLIGLGAKLDRRLRRYSARSYVPLRGYQMWSIRSTGP